MSGSASPQCSTWNSFRSVPHRVELVPVHVLVAAEVLHHSVSAVGRDDNEVQPVQRVVVVRGELHIPKQWHERVLDVLRLVHEEAQPAIGSFCTSFLKRGLTMDYTRGRRGPAPGYCQATADMNE